MALLKYLKRGDSVVVITGRDRGKTGKVLGIDRQGGYVLIEGVNIVCKTRKPRNEGEKGSIVNIEAKLSVSNVMLKCSKCGPMRTSVSAGSGDRFGSKKVCRKCRAFL